MRLKKLLMFLMALSCLSLSGCMLQSVENLYALPRQSAEYYALQDMIDEVLQTGAEYCAPVSGDRRQAVQLADLDSDGKEEAIVFIRTQGEKPLKIYIFRQTEGGYRKSAVIEGDGSAFESVRYCQMDTELGLELVVGRQVSAQVPQTLSIFSLQGDHVEELLNVSCIRHTLADLDGNGLQELLVFRTDEDAAVGLTDYYKWTGAAMELAGSADMTAALTGDSIRRIIRGMMQEDTPAIFLANTYEESTIVTDVFILDDGAFKNVSAQSANDATRVRYRSVYAVDIDGDTLIELPEVVRLERYPGVTGDALDKLKWYNLRRDGMRVYKQSTFHNYADGWYIGLLPQWETGLSAAFVCDAQQLPCYRFRCNDGEGKELFAIYAFANDDAKSLAATDGRFVLAEKGDLVFCGQIFDETIAQDQLRSAFHFIYTDWNSGEV